MAKWANRVTVLVRAQSLAETMSDYLIRQIDAIPNIDVCYHVQVTDGTGAGHLPSLILADTATGARRSVPAHALFVHIRSQPRTPVCTQARSAVTGSKSAEGLTVPGARRKLNHD